MLPVGLNWLKRHAGTPPLRLILPSLKRFAAALLMSVVVTASKTLLLDGVEPRLALGSLILIGVVVYATSALILDRRLLSGRPLAT